MNDVERAALAALTAGLSVVPPREDGSKRPIGEWKQFQAQRPTNAQIDSWYRGGRTGLGVVCGAVSGGLEMLELEGRAVADGIHDRFREIAEAAGLGDVLSRIEAGYVERTPSGGYHLLYRVSSPQANTKLARRPATADELVENPADTIKVLIESRGEGGYCILAPSHGRVHPSGGAWQSIAGGFDHIITISDEERDELWRLAQTLDRMPETPPRAGSVEGEEERPGDAFNAAPDAQGHVLELLLDRGWTVVYRQGEVVYLRRPGKDVGVSATLGHVGPGVLRVFTTSTEFEARAYSPFSVYATLKHGGDFSAAARALRLTTPELRGRARGPWSRSAPNQQTRMTCASCSRHLIP